MKDNNDDYENEGLDFNAFKNDRLSAALTYAMASEDLEETMFQLEVEYKLDGIFGVIDEQLKRDAEVDLEDRDMCIIMKFPKRSIIFSMVKEVLFVLSECYGYTVQLEMDDEDDFIDTYNLLITEMVENGDKMAEKAIDDYLQSLDELTYKLSWDFRGNNEEQDGK